MPPYSTQAVSGADLDRREHSPAEGRAGSLTESGGNSALQRANKQFTRGHGTMSLCWPLSLSSDGIWETANTERGSSCAGDSAEEIRARLSSGSGSGPIV